MGGKFLISLDFELHWGVFDALSLETYQKNLENVRTVIERLIKLSDSYNIKLTFSTVGLLFAENKGDIKKFMPSKIPNYNNKELNPFRLINSIGETEKEDPIHYAKSIISAINKNHNHEIGTHTFAHYNCLASGQDIIDFTHDLTAAINIAKSMDIDIKSIVFPKNQIKQDYLEVCKRNGITSFRGTEEHFLYNPSIKTKNFLFIKFHRPFRFLDGYINISGHNTYSLDSLLDRSGLINLPSSRFLRPFIPRLSCLEFLKRERIKKAMQYAAIKGELFHLWWHPHNFGSNMDANFKNLEIIFKEYKNLNKKFGFESITMTGLTNQIKTRQYSN
ncbi:polysaccharide deacetylase [Gaetbulibacter sp. M235]|uniref:polysaccharide deacetylase family protein n=1 Tax=Gaetbulibacter sp. M235 TaxID=3126510 RepID=UPI00374E9129